MRVVKVFWSLEDRLAARRHFPAISWLNSYSLYTDVLKNYLTSEVSEDFVELQKEAMKLLEEEAELEEIVRLVGFDALSPQDRLVLEAARSIREDFLHQNAFHETDTYTSLQKQYRMLRLILHFYFEAREALQKGASVQEVEKLGVREKIARAKYLPEEGVETMEEIEKEVAAAVEALLD